MLSRYTVKTGYIRPHFNFAQFAQLRLGEFKKWANQYKLLTTNYYIFYIVMYNDRKINIDN